MYSLALTDRSGTIPCGDAPTVLSGWSGTRRMAETAGGHALAIPVAKSPSQHERPRKSGSGKFHVAGLSANRRADPLAAPLEGKTESGADQHSSGAAIKSSRNGGAAEPGSERPYRYGQKSEPQQAFRNVNEGE